MKGLSLPAVGTEKERKSEHVCRKGAAAPFVGRNDRMKVNEEKGIEKECPREGRIRTRAHERERQRESATEPRRGTVVGGGGEASARINT